jgi:hypothetical protein
VSHHRRHQCLHIEIMRNLLLYLILFISPFALHAKENKPSYTDLSAEYETLKNNQPYNRGYYVFGSNFIFDFQKNTLDMVKYDDSPPPPGGYSLQYIKDCSSIEYYCFNADKTKLVFPKKCSEFVNAYKNSKIFQIRDIKTKIIRYIPVEAGTGYHMPDFVAMHRYFLMNPNYPYIIYEYGVSAGNLNFTEPSIRRIYYGESIEFNFETYWQDENTLKIEPARVNFEKNRLYSVAEYRGADPFGQCVN